MSQAAWILAGGASRRMGQDKALLPWGGQPLILALASLLARVAPPVHIVGPSHRYSHLGLPVIEDRRPGCGPLGGIEAALHATEAERNLIVACDMPRLSESLLQRLLETPGRCVLACTPDGRQHPLCAVWDRRLRRKVTAALDQGVRRVRDVLDTEEVVKVAVDSLINANTPEEWEAASRG